MKLQKRRLIFGLLALAFSIASIYLVVAWFLGLDALYPGQFSFQIDLSNLRAQANGLAWTLTIILVIFYWISGLFLIMEGKVSKVEVQRKFYYSLALLFMLIGLAQGAVVFYSIFKLTPPFGFAPDVMPVYGLLNSRGDINYAFALACWSTILIIHSIEKYIKNSKKYPLTILVAIGCAGGALSIAFSYIQAVYWPDPAKPPSWWVYISYGTIGFAVLGIILTIIALPVIYFALARQTSGSLQKNSIIIGIGYIVTFVMVLLHLLRSMILQSLPLGWMIFIFGNIVGALILMSGYIRSTY